MNFCLKIIMTEKGDNTAKIHGNCARGVYIPSCRARTPFYMNEKAVTVLGLKLYSPLEVIFVTRKALISGEKCMLWP